MRSLPIKHFRICDLEIQIGILFIFCQILGRQLDTLGLSAKPQMVSRFQEIYRQIWPVNGDHISRIYAGTSAMTVGKSKVLHNIHTNVY